MKFSAVLASDLAPLVYPWFDVMKDMLLLLLAGDCVLR